MGVILCVIVVVFVAALTGLSTWTVLFGIVAILIAWFVWSIKGSSKQSVDHLGYAQWMQGSDNRSNAKGQGLLTVASAGLIVSGLIVRPEPLEGILSKTKIWEIRAERTLKRETIALIEKGSKRILGVARVIDCIGPLSYSELVASYSAHGIGEARLNDPAVAKYRYAWVLADVQRLKNPVPAPLKRGQQKFVNLPPETVAAVLKAL